jgi:Nucleotidyl transferase AbiEii toxin, Type IV TA system
MAQKISDIAASVHQRLLNKARNSSRPFNELLQHFAIERFMYRLSSTPQANRFILKGALMFPAWSGRASRPTMDIDLLGRIDNNPNTIVTAMREACNAVVQADGMTFEAQTVTATRITEGAEYGGVRVRIKGRLGNARFHLQVDVGFGDVIIPGPIRIEYPALLDFPPPVLNGYTRESTIAEKFHAMVKLGVLNSRMKDFYDIWMLSRMFCFAGATLADAIGKTFENRKTPITPDPIVFEMSFAEDHGKDVQWRAFVRKTNLTDAPASFVDVAGCIKAFLLPVVGSLAEKRYFRSTWNPPGPWI